MRKMYKSDENFKREKTKKVLLHYSVRHDKQSKKIVN